MTDLLVSVLSFAAVSILVFPTIALVLVFSQYPRKLSGSTGLDFTAQLSGEPGDTARPSKLLTYAAKDGEQLFYRKYDSDNDKAPLLVLVHGSGWHGLALVPMARKLADFGVTDVVVPDLRGHGKMPHRRGDVDYIGQLEDDLAALIELQKKPGQKVILGGHSSGGGLVVRFAGGKHRQKISAAILLAPFLKYNAPTTRPASGGWAHPSIRRIIGLAMLNAVGITVLNYLPVIQFAFPNEVLDGPLGETATTQYSFRLNTSFAPRNNYLKDIAALPKFLLVVGNKDEAFFAKKYEPTMSAVNSNGSYVVIDNASHLEIQNDERVIAEITRFIEGLRDGD